VNAPPVRYADSGGVEIAYQVLGEGPRDLIWAAGAITHLGVMWEHPGYRRFCEQLASFTRLILFDKRGMGLSERVRVGTLEERMDDVRAVLDAVNSERTVLAGVSEGGPLSMLFAANVMLATGVTAFQPTFVTAPEEELVASLREVPSGDVGPRILRAETAALAAITSYMALAGDWR